MINALKYICIGLVSGLIMGAFSAFFIARDHYKNDARITTLAAQNAALMADLVISRSAEARALEATETIARINQENEHALTDLMDSIQKRPQDSRCVLSAADADRLRNLK